MGTTEGRSRCGEARAKALRFVASHSVPSGTRVEENGAIHLGTDTSSLELDDGINATITHDCPCDRTGAH